MKIPSLILISLILALSYIECSKNKHVVIIGAGMSGLAAAYELTRNGFTNVTVIEGQNYLGGRINTVALTQTVSLERGAQWIHGKIKNPLFDFFNPLGFVDEQLKTLSGGSILFATPDATQLNEASTNSIKSDINAIYNSLSNKISQLSSDRSFASLFNSDYNQIAGQFADRNLADALYDNVMKEERITTACEDLNLLSSIGWNTGITYGGDRMINLKNGYSKLTDYLASFLPASKIKLNEKVVSIDWSLRQPIVNTTIGSYTADYVVVTISLGALKSSHQSLFHPSLPASKVAAINKLGFGTVNKFFLIFNSTFFTNNEQGFEIVWKSGLNISLSSLAKYNIASSQFYKTFNSFEVHPVHKNILYTFLYGSNAIFSENLTDACLIEVFTELLTKVYPQVTFPKIDSLFRSKWYSNEFMRGAYSHIAMNSSTSDIDALVQSMNSTIYWAGEATALGSISTVHGAFESGLREARKIIALNSSASISMLKFVSMLMCILFTTF